MFILYTYEKDWAISTAADLVWDQFSFAMKTKQVHCGLGDPCSMIQTPDSMGCKKNTNNEKYPFLHICDVMMSQGRAIACYSTFSFNENYTYVAVVNRL